MMEHRPDSESRPEIKSRPDTEKRPQVSIVIAFFNAETFIEQTLDSVVNQTMDDWELILVNDGSTDKSERIVESVVNRHPDKMFYLTHDNLANKGVCVSRNLGVSHARGEYIAFLDADDVWQPDKLAEQTAILSTYAAVGMVVGAPRYWRRWANSSTHGSRDYTPRLGLKANTVHRAPTLLAACHPLGKASAPCPSDIMLRREVVDRVGGFEEAFTGNFQMYEDQAFLAKIYLSTDVYVSGSTWTYYRLHDQSCCHRVTSSGEESAVRGFYLDWLRDYLDGQGVENERIHRALDKARQTGDTSYSGRLAGKSVSAIKAFLQRCLP